MQKSQRVLLSLLFYSSIQATAQGVRASFFLLMADIMVNLDRFEKQDLLSGVTHVSVYRKLGGISIECYKTYQLIKKLKKSQLVSKNKVHMF